mmetsp:Transcript_7892/g.15295  ORF Transcript_7892/g.15295 Transcript_7892/m.15295 type:complete len:100 (-) Transcript_7892:1062-1361(-)
MFARKGMNWNCNLRRAGRRVVLGLAKERSKKEMQRGGVCEEKDGLEQQLTVGWVISGLAAELSKNIKQKKGNVRFNTCAHKKEEGEQQFGPIGEVDVGE